MTGSTRQETHDFFHLLFAPDDIIEFRLLPSKKSEWATLKDLPALWPKFQVCNTTGNQNIYFGVNPRSERGAKKADTITVARALFADLDHCTLEQGQIALAESGLPDPTFTVVSGHGVHFYWVLDKPVDPKEWQPLQKRLIHAFNGKADKAIHDPPRIMRVPGFLNVKAEPYIPCEIADVTRKIYKLADLPLPEPAAHPQKTEKAKKVRHGSALEKAISTAKKIIADSADGQKHDDLIRASRLLGGYVGAGEITYEAAFELLKGAIEKRLAGGGGNMAPALQTIRDGLTHGVKDPIKQEDRVIRIDRGDVMKMVSDAERAVIKSGLPIFKRTGTLVRIIQSGIPPALCVHGGGHSIRIKEMDSMMTIAAMAETADWERYDCRTNDWVRTEPYRMAAEILLRKGEWDIPTLTGIIESPTIRRDGTILQKPGYDPATGLYLDCRRMVFPDIPEAPTKDDAAAAMAVLTEPIKAFPFVGPVDRSVAIAAIITAMVRQTIRTAPIFGFSAPKMGSGKSLLADVVSLVSTGIRCQMFSQPRNLEEEMKTLAGALMAGERVICFDNCDRALQSDQLCIILTQDTWQARRLGTNTIVPLGTASTFLATGNNLTFQGDLSTRALVCNLDAGIERPEERSFDRNLFEWIPKHRGELVKAAITIIRAYVQAGMPSQGIKNYGRFEDWSRLIRSALVWIGEADPCACRESIEGDDPVRNALASILQIWHSRFPASEVRLSEIVSEAKKMSDSGDSTFLELLTNLVGGDGKAINTLRLAKRLRQFCGRIESGYRLVKGERDNTNSTAWKVIKIWANSEEDSRSSGDYRSAKALPLEFSNEDTKYINAKSKEGLESTHGTSELRKPENCNRGDLI